MGTPVSSTNVTDHHDMTVILLKVVLNTITLFEVQFYTFIFFQHKPSEGELFKQVKIHIRFLLTNYFLFIVIDWIDLT